MDTIILGNGGDYPPIQPVLDRERKRADDYLRMEMNLV